MNTNPPSGPLFTWTQGIYALHAFSLPTGIVSFWFVYRIVRGWLALRDGRPMYAQH